MAVYAGKTLTAQQVQTHYNAGLGSIVTPSPAPSATPSPTPPPPTPPPSPTPPPGPSSLQIVQSAAIDQFARRDAVARARERRSFGRNRLQRKNERFVRDGVEPPFGMFPRATMTVKAVTAW